MKKNLFLALGLAFALSVCSFAQTQDFRTATRELLETNNAGVSPSKIRDTMKGVFSSLLAQMGQKDAAGEMDRVLDALLGSYFESGELMEDLVDVYAPVLAKEFTLDELRQVRALYDSPEGRAFMEKSAAMTDNLGDATRALMEPLMKIAMGGEAPQVERVDCPEEYRRVFMEYFHLTGDVAMDALQARLGGAPGGDKIKAYIMEAVPEFSLRTAYPTLTLDDLRGGIRLVSQPLVQRYIHTAGKVSEADMAPLMKKIQKKIGEAVPSVGK